jgi:hypothetical protein
VSAMVSVVSATRLRTGAAAVLRRLRAPRRRGRERGTFTIAVVFWVLMTALLAAFVVDGGLSISERERAGDLAQQAARAVANDLNLNDLRNGQIKINFNADGTCTQDQQNTVLGLLETDGLQDTDLKYCGLDPDEPTTTAGGQIVPVVEVEINVPYHQLFLDMFYSNPVSVTASATAYPEPGI